VTISASGIRWVFSAATASSRSSLSPLCATITGSSTMRATRYSCSLRATVSISSGENSMPIFTASAPTSGSTASSCWATKSTGAAWIAATPCVFCAVSAVITLMP
jgi:hypothetical protein